MRPVNVFKIGFNAGRLGGQEARGPGGFKAKSSSS
jgi:hypothetical protein